MLYESSYYGIAGLGDDSLQHHGIKGQKWGVRRFQNADGSLTPEGQKRYGTTGYGPGTLNRTTAKAYEKYGLVEPNPNKNQAWDNARTMLDKGASDKEISKYLKASKFNDDDVKKWMLEHEGGLTNNSRKKLVINAVKAKEGHGDIDIDKLPDTEKKRAYIDAVNKFRQAKQDGTGTSFAALSAASRAYAKELVGPHGKKQIKVVDRGSTVRNGYWQDLKETYHERLDELVLMSLTRQAGRLHRSNIIHSYQPAMKYESEYYGVLTVPFEPELKHQGITDW